MSTMYPERKTVFGVPAPSRIRKGGFALVSAIFLLVVLAALGAFMLTFSSVQNATSAQDMQGGRAYQAARAGIEWGVFQVMNQENTNPPAGQPQYVCGSPPPFPTLGGGLSGFTVDVQCDMRTYDESGNVIRVYTMTSTATMGTVGSSTYVERKLSATVGTCRKSPDGPSC